MCSLILTHVPLPLLDIITLFCSHSHLIPGLSVSSSLTEMALDRHHPVITDIRGWASIPDI